MKEHQTIQTWYPIARADDAPKRSVYQGKLLGRELAVWRDDDGFVNVWENRCLHRGVRLSIGTNRGYELSCIYHGWRYASRSAGCTYIPAHPADAPAQTICNTTYPVAERYGLIWSTMDPDAGSEPAPIEVLDAGSPFPLRSLPVNADAAHTREALADYALASDGDEIVFFVQPVDADACVVRPVLAQTPPASERVATLRAHATELNRLRTRIEADAAQRPTPAPIEVEPIEVPVALSTMPSLTAADDTPISVVVQRKWVTADGVAAFALAPLAGTLPTAQPGAHIDVRLPNAMVRQYSLTNRSGEAATYVIGVKREPKSRGGSEALHETIHEGDVLRISAPRNNFPLRRDAERSILIAGGIGVTPLLSMAQTLLADDLPVELHYFAQDERHLAFRETLDSLGPTLVTHLGLDPAGTGAVLSDVLGPYEPSSHVYICGPGPMLDAARTIAADAGWPDSAVHFEYFKNVNEIDTSSSFEISLSRSALTVTVNAGESVLDVLRANGVALASSCQQGACGTCIVGVIEGEPDHQDVYLSQAEQATGNTMMTCVSRSKSDRLVLDI